MVEEWEQDGYRMARARYFRDQEVAQGSEDLEAIAHHLTTIKNAESLLRAQGMYHRQFGGLGWDALNRTEKDMEKMSFLAVCVLFLSSFV